MCGSSKRGRGGGASLLSSSLSKIEEYHAPMISVNIKEGNKQEMEPLTKGESRGQADEQQARRAGRGDRKSVV